MSPSLLAALVSAIGLVAACRGDALPVNGTRLVEAPIESVEVVPVLAVRVQYSARIVSALPNGCHTYHDAEVVRRGAVIDVTVHNAIPVRADLACTQLYGTVEHTIDLGTDFTPGATYRLNANGHAVTFTAW